jgi:hypothetical protein
MVSTACRKIEAGGEELQLSAQSAFNSCRQAAAKMGRGPRMPASQAIALAFPDGRN